MDVNRKVIFDLHIEIPDEHLDKNLGSYYWDTMGKSERSKLYYIEYHDRLLGNHKDYAEKIGVDFFHFERDEEYEEFYRDLKGKYPYLTEYLVINFYKLYLFQKLSHIYDEVLYVDFDVAFLTEENYFDQFDTTKGIYLAVDDMEVEAMHDLLNSDKKLNLRSMVNKWFICYAMLMDTFEDFDNRISNTGIMLGNSHWIQELDFMGQLDHMVTLITRLRDDEDSMYTDRIRETLDWNNEPMFVYAAHQKGVPLINNGGMWNYIVNYRGTKDILDRENPKVVHMILKRFDWIWED